MPPPTQRQPRKFFVGGLASSVDDGDFRRYFETFGPLADAVVMVDRTTNKSRGFGFVTFVEDGAARAVASQRHELHGKTVDVKSAEPMKSDEPRGGGGQYGGGGGGGGQYGPGGGMGGGMAGQYGRF